MMRTNRRTDIALILGALVVLVFSAANADAMGLKQNSTISQDMIMVSDIFYGLPAHKDKALGPAPRPGHDMVLNARTLMRIALALDLPWRPTSSNEYVVLSRAATLVDADMIKGALKAPLAESGIAGAYNIAFVGNPAEMILPPEMSASVEVEDINVRADRGWFEATLAAPSKENPIQRLQISGKIERLVELPVMANSLRNGTSIGPRDITFISVPERAVQPDMILREDALIGMTPRRMLMAGEPIKSNEIIAPRMIKRGDNVTMVLRDGGLQLTALGKALEDGAKGDIIRVVNATSNRTIQAEVSGEKEVTLASFQ